MNYLKLALVGIVGIILGTYLGRRRGRRKAENLLKKKGNKRCPSFATLRMGEAGTVNLVLSYC